MADAFWVLVVVLTALGALAVAYTLWGRQRFERADLRQRFGPEYERAVLETGSGKAARRELRRRMRRAARLEIRQLTPEERARFRARWHETQARFVDDPVRATRDSGGVIDSVMLARGYEVEDPEGQLNDLSVYAPDAATHARRARDLARPGASTEELRRATRHYQAALDELLGDDTIESSARNELPRGDLA